MSTEDSIYNYFKYVSDKVYHGYKYPNTSESCEYGSYKEQAKQRYEAYVNLIMDLDKRINTPGYSDAFYRNMKKLYDEDMSYLLSYSEQIKRF